MKLTTNCIKEYLLRKKVLLLYTLFCVFVFFTKILSVNKLSGHPILDLREGITYLISAGSFYYIQRFLDLDRIKREYIFWTTMNHTELCINTQVCCSTTGKWTLKGSRGYEEFLLTHRNLIKTLSPDDILIKNFSYIKMKLIDMQFNSGNFKPDIETERILNGNTKICIKWYIDNL